MVKGHKRHLLVETLGLLLQVIVSAANVSEKAGAKLLLEKSEGQFPRLQKIFADGGYDGKDFSAAVKQDYQLDGEVVKRKPEKQIFLKFFHSKDFSRRGAAGDS